MEKCTNYVEATDKSGKKIGELFAQIIVETFNKLCSFETVEEMDQYIETLPEEIKKYFKQKEKDEEATK